MLGTFDIDHVHLVLVEVAIVLFGQFFGLVGLAYQIHFHGVVTELSHQLLNVFSLLVGKLTHVLVLSNVGVVSKASSVFNLQDWVETVEEGLEVDILGILWDSGNSGSLWLVVGFDESFANSKSIFLLFNIGTLSDPDVDVLVQLEDKSIIGIEVVPSQRSLCNFSGLQLTSFVGYLKQLVV